MDFDELKEELRQAYRDGDFTVQEYLAELKALREDSTKEKKRERSSSRSRSDGAQHRRTARQAGGAVVAGLARRWRVHGGQGAGARNGACSDSPQAGAEREPEWGVGQ